MGVEEIIASIQLEEAVGVPQESDSDRQFGRGAYDTQTGAYIQEEFCQEGERKGRVVRASEFREEIDPVSGETLYFRNPARNPDSMTRGPTGKP